MPSTKLTREHFRQFPSSSKHLKIYFHLTKIDEIFSIKVVDMCSRFRSDMSRTNSLQFSRFLTTHKILYKRNILSFTFWWRIIDKNNDFGAQTWRILRPGRMAWESLIGWRPRTKAFRPGVSQKAPKPLELAHCLRLRLHNAGAQALKLGNFIYNIRTHGRLSL
jgi:hypothetical protein